LKTSNRTIGLFIPGEPNRAEIPPSPNLTTLLEGYKGDELRAEGEEFDPSPANVEMRTTRVDLPGGTKLLMLPKETRGDAVFASIALRIGDEGSLRNTDGASSLTAQMLMRGTKNRTRQQIQDELNRLQSQLNVGGGAGTVSLNVQSTRENLAAVLELGLEVLREPAFPETELETLRTAALAGIEQSRSQPQVIVQRAYQRHWSQYPRGDIRYVPTLDEEVARLRALNVQRLREFHTGFYGASNAEVAIVGDFDADAIRSLIATKLDGWKSPRPYREVLAAFPNPPIAPVNEEFETPDKENAVFIAGMPIQMTDAHADYPALVLGNYLLGGSASSRLFERIRVQEGLSYGVGSQFQASAQSDRAQFSANGTSAPQNAKKVEASFRDELAKVLRDGFAADELATGKTSWAQARQVGRADDGQLMGRLLGLMHNGRTMTWDADFEAKVQALTVDEIRAAMQRHFAADKMAFMLGGDFAGAAAAPAAASN
jgi:zinc protease